MTCEVAVMNRRGIALAADSAVTLGDSKKIYNTAEKLFPISPSIPVAIMTFGNADMMDAPWETIIKMYAQKLGDRTFDTLEQYAANFLSFIEGSPALFPPSKQSEYVRGVVSAVWSGYCDELEERIQTARNVSAAKRRAAFADIIRKDHRVFAKYDDLEGLGPSYGALVLKMYAKEIDEVEAQVFEGLKLEPPIRQALRMTVELMFGKRWIHPVDESNVVVAGMGNEEPFPAYLHYEIGTVAAGKLRCIKASEGRIGADDDAIVRPFAQRQTIDMIISGIHPMLQKRFVDDIDHLLPRTKKSANDQEAERIDKLKREFEAYVSERYEAPFMAAVSGLPRQDLARMAEALVSLTAFVMRMTADQDETVAEPIDVAILSKGDGFTWVKHKDLIRETGSLGQ